MKKKTWIIIIFLLLLVIGIFAWWKLSKNKDEVLLEIAPSLEIVSIKVTDLDKDRIYLNIETYLSNSFPFQINTGNLDYHFYIDSLLILKKTLNKPISIEPGDSMLIKLPVTVQTSELTKILKSWAQTGKDSADYNLHLELAVNMPTGKVKNFEYKKSLRLPTLQVPESKLKDYKIEKLGFKNSKLKLIMAIYNPNKYVIKASKPDYHLKIGNELEVDGTLENPLILAAKDTTEVTVNIDIQKVNLPKLVWETLFEKKKTAFTFDFSGKMVSENKLIDGSKIKLHAEGNLKEAEEAIETIKDSK